MNGPAFEPPAFKNGGCRADVWLWRARFFKTRSLAAKYIDEGRVRLSRAGQDSRLDKASRNVKVGDGLVFALGGRLIAVQVAALGEKRGSGPEARGLYSPLQNSSLDGPSPGIDKAAPHREKPAPNSPGRSLSSR